MTKATAIKPLPKEEHEVRECAVCRKRIIFPYGRMNHDRDWVCSSNCEHLYRMYWKEKEDGNEEMRSVRFTDDTGR